MVDKQRTRRDHFEGILNAGQPSKRGICREMSEWNKQSNNLLLDITRQEVMWALVRLKGKAAPGKDGLMAEIINVILVDFGTNCLSCVGKR